MNELHGSLCSRWKTQDSNTGLSLETGNPIPKRNLGIKVLVAYIVKFGVLCCLHG